MTTENQIAANQRNAKMSTGPTSPGGRERASRNALRHGLTASDVVLKTEQAADFERFYEGYVNQLKPEGDVEESLVERIVFGQWRLRRIPRYEAAMIEETGRQLHEEFSFNKLEDLFALQTAVRNREQPGEGATYLNLFSDRGRNGALTSLARRESVIERAIASSWTELERLQARRRGKVVSQTAHNVVELNGGTSLEGRPSTVRHRSRPK